LYLGSSVRVKLTLTVFVAALLQGLPAPVHTPAGMVTTVVAEVVLTVWVPEQLVPNVAPLQVYFSASPVEGGVAMQGPPDEHVKSVVAFTVIVPLPVEGVVRAR
jgi:hypothetical protein